MWLTCLNSCTASGTGSIEALGGAYIQLNCFLFIIVITFDVTYSEEPLEDVLQFTCQSMVERIIHSGHMPNLQEDLLELYLPAVLLSSKFTFWPISHYCINMIAGIYCS